MSYELEAWSMLRKVIGTIVLVIAIICLILTIIVTNKLQENKEGHRELQEIPQYEGSGKRSIMKN